MQSESASRDTTRETNSLLGTGLPTQTSLLRRTSIRGFDEFAGLRSLKNPDEDILDFGELINEYNHLPPY